MLVEFLNVGRNPAQEDPRIWILHEGGRGHNKIQRKRVARCGIVTALENHAARLTRACSLSSVNVPPFTRTPHGELPELSLQRSP